MEAWRRFGTGGVAPCWWFSFSEPRPSPSLSLHGRPHAASWKELSSPSSYLDRHIGDIHTYSRGKAIAARCPELDRIAEASGVHPISFFGFADDFHGETVTWHEVADGLSTFTAVRALSSSSREASGASGDVVC